MKRKYSKRPGNALLPGALYTIKLILPDLQEIILENISLAAARTEARSYGLRRFYLKVNDSWKKLGCG